MVSFSLQCVSASSCPPDHHMPALVDWEIPALPCTLGASIHPCEELARNTLLCRVVDMMEEVRSLWTDQPGGAQLFYRGRTGGCDLVEQKKS